MVTKEQAITDLGNAIIIIAMRHKGYSELEIAEILSNQH